MVRQVDEQLLKIGRVKEGDLVVIIAGSPPGIPGSTNALRIHRMGDAINEVAPAYRRELSAHCFSPTCSSSRSHARTSGDRHRPATGPSPRHADAGPACSCTAARMSSEALTNCHRG